MIARVITFGVAVARGVGGRRGRAKRTNGVAAIENLFRAMDQDPVWRAVFDECDRRDPRMRKPLGYRERKRRADLRRRARDRDVANHNAGLDQWVGRWVARHPDERGRLGRVLGSPWWSTPEGRRRWTEADRARKRARRGAT